MTELFAEQVDACSDVSPLVAATYLEFAIEILAQMVKIISLQEHVTEFSIADADFPFSHSGAHRFLAYHLVNSEIFSNVAQEIEQRHLFCPIRIIGRAHV